MKDSQVEKPKFRSQKQKALALQRFNSNKTFKQAWKEKKKEKQKSPNQEKKAKDTTPATVINITNISGGHSNGSGDRSKRS